MTKNLQLITSGSSPLIGASEDRVAKIAASLNISLQIQPGKALIMILGNGDEETNREALITWTRATLAREGIPASREALGTLIPLLKQELVEIDPSGAD